MDLNVIVLIAFFFVLVAFHLSSGYTARMDARLPDFFAPPVNLPPFLLPPVTPMSDTLRKASRAVSAAEFEMVFPRILEMMAAGYTANRAIAELPIPVDAGGFMRWIKKDGMRYALYQEAQEVRSEVWADTMIDLATGRSDDVVPMELDRARFAVDTYKFLIKAQNKKVYGDTKQVEITQTISITGALQAAQSRVAVMPTITLDNDDYETISPQSYNQIEAPRDEDDYDDD